jgi:TolB-like protein/tetratricopeptide (TPR) repeat protein
MLYKFEDFVLDTERRELRRLGEAIAIEPRVFDLIVYLVENRGRVVTRDDLLASVWGGRIVSESALRSCINAARCALGDTGEAQRLIKTLARKGVRFIGEVLEAERKPAAVGSVPSDAPISSPVLLHKPSIAVLPFTSISRDPEEGYFADGLAEDITTALSRCNWLFVIERNASLSSPGQSVNARQVGRELGVRYVLEGSVRRAGDRLRAVAQLVDATTGAHIWAGRFDGATADVLDLQDHITESVVGAIEPKLQHAEIERVKAAPAASLSACQHVLRAQELEYKFTEESYAAAIQHLDQALAIDPGHAPAMALKAYCFAERRVQGWAHDSDAEADDGHRLAARCAELARDDPNVLWMVAYAIRVLGCDPLRARELHSLSLQLNPYSAKALTASAWNEALLSGQDDALQMVRRAERISSPADPRAWSMTAAGAQAHLQVGEYQDAAALARRALARNPRSTRTLRILAASLAGLGERGRAAEAIRLALAVEPDLTISRLRVRLNYWPEQAWSNFADCLHLAGLPE